MKVINKLTTLKNVNTLRSNNIDNIILHSTYSHKNFNHVLNTHYSYGWNGVGYHYFIDKKGTIFQARGDNHEGAHALGYNTSSLGICVYSEKGILSSKNKLVVQSLIKDLSLKYKNPEIISHTHAQARYCNSFLNSIGYENILPDTPEIVFSELFDKTLMKLNSISEKLSSSKYHLEKQALKFFKNCPGPFFFEVVK
jgi:hypothetical protein